MRFKRLASEIVVLWISSNFGPYAKPPVSLAFDKNNMLAALLVEVDTQGTGFGPADVDDLLHDIASGRSHRRPAKNSKVRCRIGKWSWTLNKNNWVDWLARVEPLWIELSPLEWIAERLELPEQWRGEE